MSTPRWTPRPVLTTTGTARCAGTGVRTSTRRVPAGSRGPADLPALAA